jgi:hypothetical protein
MTDPKWKRFENVVAKVQRSLAPAASVLQNQRIAGRHSNTQRQIEEMSRPLLKVGGGSLTTRRPDDPPLP